MFDDYSISPYPGLRSFSEDESIFFKGRDVQILEIVRLLQTNKFLMVTGASGDGKSSIIFSGLVPNARAGFFKAKYNRWEVAHFRPERTPVHNLSNSLAPLLNAGEETVETELNRGFGSLVELYKGSDLFMDENANVWQNANEEERADLTRSNANLLVIVDQFEEFFTNPENYHNGTPSEQAQTLVNLLLETARIALRDDLPIYIVFTMRSDYIGQCAAFRNLPEFIGFSQFFVPRLKRKELKQIIEEPAKLNGNSIAPRLVERLLYDLSEGIDQLPVLQHALSQIWLMADSGKEEMDLLHYAKVGGMAESELPREDQAKYEGWYDTLEEWRKEHLRKPGLNQVLDIHADSLYEGAWDYVEKNKTAHSLTRKDAKNIIALTFACLTKIDHSRAVRNRMTLQEITNIINKPGVTTEVVAAVINSYREQGNTFIRPFIDETNPESRSIGPDTVLDITHESLIRNWQRLSKWANKEFEYLEIFLDFKKQLDKWLESNKSSGYLLPIGPLTFFEEWENECKPNKHWINRYNSENDDVGKNLDIAQSLLDNIHEFLRRSTRKIIVSKTFMKYGTLKIAVSIALVLVFILSSFYYFDAREKQNKNVIDRVQENGRELLTDDNIRGFSGGLFLMSSEMLKEGSIFQNLSLIKNDLQRIETSLFLHESLLFLDPNFSLQLKHDLADELKAQFLARDQNDIKELEDFNSFIDNLGYDYVRNNEIPTGIALQEQTAELPQFVRSIINDISSDQIVIFNNAIENYINWNNSLDEVDDLIELLSPFSTNSQEQFDLLYPVQSGIQNGRNRISHGGGYQLIASLYALKGDLAHVKQATDSLLKYNDSYFDILTFNNGANILGYLVQGGHTTEAKDYLNFLSDRTGISKRSLMNLTLDRAGGLNHMFRSFRWGFPSDYNPNLSLIQQTEVEYLFDLYEEAINEEETGDARNMYLAILYKQRGSYLSKIKHSPGIIIDPSEANVFYEKAIAAYSRVSENYRDQTENINYKYFGTGIRNKSFSYKYFFLYPDYLYNQWHSDKFVSTGFAEYLIDNDLLDQLYESVEDLEAINDWIANYNEYYPFENNTRMLTPFEPSVLERLKTSIIGHRSSKEFDMTFINLLLANHLLDNDATEEAMQYFKEIDLKKIGPLANRWEYLNYTFIYNQLSRLAVSFALQEYFSESIQLVEVLPNDVFKSFVYSLLSRTVHGQNASPTAFIYLDSAMATYKRLNRSDMDLAPIDPESALIQTLSAIGGEKLRSRAMEIYRELPMEDKINASFFLIAGITYEGNYHLAYESIPDDAPLFSLMNSYNNMLFFETTRRGVRPGWEEVQKRAIALNSNEYIVFRNNN